MKLKYTYYSILVVLLTCVFWGSFGCSGYLTVPPMPALDTPTPTATATFTPTVVSTPTCVSAQSVTIPVWVDSSGMLDTNPTPFVAIRSLTDWNNYCVFYSPVPPAPVTFSQYMILAFSQNYPTTCQEYVNFTQVCYFSDHIEVHYDYRGLYWDSGCNYAPNCGQAFTSKVVAVEVPYSTLPVTWIQNNLCP